MSYVENVVDQIRFIVISCSLSKSRNLIFLEQARRKRGGWGGGLQPPNISLKFADFVSEKGCKSQGRMKEDSNLYTFEEANRIDQKCNIF